MVCLSTASVPFRRGTERRRSRRLRSLSCLFPSVFLVHAGHSTPLTGSPLPPPNTDLSFVLAWPFNGTKERRKLRAPTTGDLGAPKKLVKRTFHSCAFHALVGVAKVRAHYPFGLLDHSKRQCYYSTGLCSACGLGSSRTDENKVPFFLAAKLEKVLEVELEITERLTFLRGMLICSGVGRRLQQSCPCFYLNFIVKQGPRG